MFTRSLESPLESLDGASAQTGPTPPDRSTLHILTAPSAGAMTVAVSFLVLTAVACTGVCLSASYWGALFFLPFFVGAIVGLCAADHPVRGCLFSALFAMLAFIVCCGVRYGMRDTFCGAVLLSIVMLLAVPEAIIGALCTATIRRHVRGRRAYARWIQSERPMR
ncbi:MAG TPA: hypothetical protein VHU40_14855 [Polyangia bacterium]|jgi:hypothetical protein|nr:hypothetical protein [Polyangia bacterium]